jgi:hypothetical protein
VKQLVAVLDLPTTFDSTPEDPTPLSQTDSTDFFTQLDVQYPALFHCRIGTAIITYRDQDWYPPPGESPVHLFQPIDAPLGHCALFTDDLDHVVSHILSGCDMLIDSGSTITAQGTADGLQSYADLNQEFACAQPPDKWSHPQRKAHSLSPSKTVKHLSQSCASTL